MPPKPIDERARKVLFDHFWSSQGWLSDESRKQTPYADLAYARAQGLMFAPFSGSHDALVTKLRAAASALTLRQVADAFLASLSTRRPDLRSGLASYLLARRLKPHRFVDRLNGTWCEVCRGLKGYKREDLDVLSFERHKWGGVRHDDPLYQYLDLSSLRAALPAKPGPEDLAIFTAILKTIATTPKADGPAKLSKRLADVVPSAKTERDQLLEILAIAGILVPREERSSPGEWEHVGMWRGADGYDAKAVARIFGKAARIA